MIWWILAIFYVVVWPPILAVAIVAYARPRHFAEFVRRLRK